MEKPTSCPCHGANGDSEYKRRSFYKHINRGPNIEGIGIWPEIATSASKMDLQHMREIETLQPPNLQETSLEDHFLSGHGHETGFHAGV